jgi:MFS family permease
MEHSIVLDNRTAVTPARIMDRERRALTIGLLVAVSAVAFEALGVATVLPEVAHDLGGLGLYGWSFSAFMLTSLISTVIAGSIADTRGPAPAFAAGMALFAAGLAIAGTAGAMPVFITGRAVQGSGAGTIASMAYVSIGRGYPDEIRARMLAMLSTVWIVPGLVGPAVAGVVAEHATWRLVFLGLLPLPALAALLLVPALRRMTAMAGATAERDRIIAAIALAGGAALVLAGLTFENLVVALGAVLIGVALAWRALERIMPPGTLRARPGLPAGIAVNGLLNFGYFGAEAFVPLGLTTLRGASATRAGVVLTAATLTWTAGSWLQARLDARDGGSGRRWRVRSGAALVAAGITVTAVAVVSEVIPAVVAAGGWAIAGLGMGLAYPTITLMTLRDAPEGREGTVAGSLRVAELLAVAVGAGIGGAAVALAEQSHRPDWTAIGAAFIIALAGGHVALATTWRLASPAHQKDRPNLAPGASLAR